ncbi:alpha/beta fold hydrolase [Bradyrhizobium sp. CSA112]|nr:alpha/beta fold hydrolase [Bradyrhizobium sp. CSA112]
MQVTDDELVNFEANGAPPLPASGRESFLENDGARIWYVAYGSGPAVILLHGGLGNAGNWGHQIPAFVQARRTVVAIDSRGHGRSTRDSQPFSYKRMARDVLAVMDHLGLERAALVGWSDGACTALILADRHPERVSGVFFFACNMDSSGTHEFKPTPVTDRCFRRHERDYEALSAIPSEFGTFVADVTRRSGFCGMDRTCAAAALDGGQGAARRHLQAGEIAISDGCLSSVQQRLFDTPGSSRKSIPGS